jgi:undecaprenyl diphosphate synthase
VTETLWPDFSRAHLLTAVLEYQKRDRRYGGLSSTPMGAAPSAIAEEMIAVLPAR